MHVKINSGECFVGTLHSKLSKKEKECSLTGYLDHHTLHGLPMGKEPQSKILYFLVRVCAHAIEVQITGTLCSKDVWNVWHLALIKTL